MGVPINRAPFTALVDDDGSNSLGTPWNKAAIHGVLLDPIDAARAWTIAQVTLTGSMLDWDPGIVGDTVVYVSTGAPLTIYSLKPAAPVALGQVVRVHNISAPGNDVSFYHEHASASVGFALHCRKSPFVTVVGFWSYAEFQYGVFSGTGGWVMVGYGNGIGGPP